MNIVSMTYTQPTTTTTTTRVVVVPVVVSRYWLYLALKTYNHSNPQKVYLLRDLP